MPPKTTTIPALNLGLATTMPPTSIPVGALRVADNVSVTDDLLQSATGNLRVVSARYDEHSYMLDGLSQHFFGKVDSDNTTLRLGTNTDDAWTVEVFFRLDGMPTDIIQDASFPTATAMLLLKAPDSDLGRSPGSKASGSINWYISVISEGDGGAAGKLRARFVIGWSGGTETIDNQNDEIFIGVWYHAVMLCDGDIVSTYVHEVGTSLGTAAQGAGGHGSGGSSETVTTTAHDFFVGASPVSRSGTATVISASALVSVDATERMYEYSSTAWTKTPAAGSSVLIAGMSNAANNGVKRVTESTATSFRVSDTALVDESAGSSTTITEYHGEERVVQYGFPGIIQEVRIWDDERTVQELEDYDTAQFTDAEANSEPGLVYYQRLTGLGTDKYYFSSTKGTAGTGSGQSPRLTLMPRDATWRADGHVLGNPASGDYTIDLDGITQGLVPYDAFRYREPTVNDVGELPFPDQWAATFKVTPRTLADRQTIFHYVPVLSEEWKIHRLSETTASQTFTGLAADCTGNVLLEIVDTGGGNYQFRAVVFHVSDGGTVYATSEESSIGSGGLAAGTEYTVTVGVDAENTKLRLYVNSNTNTSSSWSKVVISGSANVAVSASGKTYTLGSGTWTTTPGIGDKILWSGFTDPLNNGWKEVLSATSNVITVRETLDDEQYAVCSAASVTATNADSTYTKNATQWSKNPSPGDVVTFSGFSASGGANNGNKTVVSSTNTTIVVTNTLVDETASATATGNVVVSVSASIATKIPSTPKGEYVATRKYAASIGRCLLRTRQLTSALGDPNGIEVNYDLSRSFDGELRQISIAVPQQAWSAESLHNLNYTQEIGFRNPAQEIGLSNVAKVGLGIVSAWPFGEGRGERVEDVATGNNLEFLEDPDHVWGRSIMPTVTKVAVDGIFDHRYLTASGETKVMIAIAGGSLYTLDVSAGTATFLTDGFRNDDGNVVSGMRYRDSLILCCGRGGQGNFHLWRDQLWRLAIEAPFGQIPFGLTDQRNKEASLQPGTYKGLLTFYSAYTGKESPIGDVFSFTILRNRANLALGEVAEINQTYPRSGLSINKEPFDLQPDDDGDRTGVRCQSWVGVSGDDELTADDPGWWQSDKEYSGSDDLTSDAKVKYKRAIFSKAIDLANDEEKVDPFIKDIEDVSAAELVQVIEDSVPRVQVVEDPNGFIEILGVFSGSNAFLRIADLAVDADPDTVSAASGVIGFPGVSGSPLTALYRGSGDVGHGKLLPVSNDPQVTHLRFYRTLANDASFRLAEEVPNGTRGFIHYTRDEELVGPVLDITSGPPPAVEYVADFAGRAVYIKDPDNPDLLYFSAPNEPWNVPAENVIKMADGDTVPLTGVGRTEGALMLFKDDTTFVLRPPVSPLVPFSIETRMRDVGCVAPYSVVNIHDKVYFCGERGMYRYDTSIPDYLSEAIEPTWLDDVDTANRNLISAVHDRKNTSWVIAYPTGNTSVGGSVVNDRMLVLDYGVGRGQDGMIYGWTRRTNLSARLWAIVPDSNDLNRVYFADPYGYIYEWDSGTDYGVGGLTAKTLTASAGASTTVTVPQATLASVPEGHLGFWVTLVRAADGSRESRYVTADSLASPSVLTVDRAWTGASPVSGDTILVGSIEAEAIFGELSPYGPTIVSQLIGMYLRATKQATSSSLIRWEWQGLGGVNNSQNEQEPSFSTVLAEHGAYFSNQKVDMAFAAAARGRRLAFRVLAKGVNMPFALRDFSILCDAVGPGEQIPLT